MIDETYSKRYYKAIAMLIGILVILLLTFIMVCYPVSAAQTDNMSLNYSSSTQNSITWNIEYKNNNRPTIALLNGVEIEGFNYLISRNYTALGLEPNTTHEFCLYDGDINCEKGITKSDIIQDNMHFYIVLIIGILSVIVASVYSRMIGFIGLMAGALLTMLSFSTMDGFSLIAGVIIALASIISVFYGNGD